MSSTSLTAANVMDKAASLMNDTARTVYTYAAQMPYLNMALSELEEHFQLSNISVTGQTSAAITVVVGVTSINPFDGVGSGPAPHYPQDLVEIQSIHERLAGSNDSFTLFTSWIWQDQRIQFNPFLSDREIKIDYIKTLFPEVTNQAAIIGVINARSFLQYKTAALCTYFIGENKERSDELNSLAILALDRVTGIGIKAKQATNTRRRPFMAAYKRRSSS